jgi:hypothetical protein
MKLAQLENLSCTETEDSLGSDECRVEVYADGGFETALRFDLDDGGSRSLDTGVVFDSVLTVKLFDEDGPLPGDDDDALGVVTVAAADVDHATATFTQDGADYTVTYSVTDRSDLTPQSMLEWTLAGFESSSAPGVWPQIDKAQLVADVRATVADPEGQVYQAEAQFCGPTSIAVELARQQPRRYVRLCQELFETGGFVSRTKTISASEALRAQPPGEGMSPADWMLVATMRDEENAVFPVEGDADGIDASIQGMTTQWEMDGWTGEVLFKDQTEISTTFVWGERDAIAYAEQVWASGGVAFLMIHSDLLLRPDEDTDPLLPDHWVVYRGGLSVTDDRIGFSVWSWARRYDVDLPTGRFEDCMYGIVTGF